MAFSGAIFGISAASFFATVPVFSGYCYLVFLDSVVLLAASSVPLSSIVVRLLFMKDFCWTGVAT